MSVSFEGEVRINDLPPTALLSTAHYSLPTVLLRFVTQVEPLNLAGASGVLIYINNSGTNSNLAGRVFGAPESHGGKTSDDICLAHADHARIASRHPNVRQVCRSVGQDRLVGSLHMCVRPQDGRDAAIEVPAHRDFFRRCFRVHIYYPNLDVG